MRGRSAGAAEVNDEQARVPTRAGGPARPWARSGLAALGDGRSRGHGFSTVGSSSSCCTTDLVPPEVAATIVKVYELSPPSTRWCRHRDGAAARADPRRAAQRGTGCRPTSRPGTRAGAEVAWLAGVVHRDPKPHNLPRSTTPLGVSAEAGEGDRTHRHAGAGAGLAGTSRTPPISTRCAIPHGAERPSLLAGAAPTLPWRWRAGLPHAQRAGGATAGERRSRRRCPHAARSRAPACASRAAARSAPRAGCASPGSRRRLLLHAARDRAAARRADDRGRGA